MGDGWVDDILLLLETTTTGLVGELYGSLSGALIGVATAFLTMFIIFMGFKALNGKTNGSEFLEEMIKIAVIWFAIIKTNQVLFALNLLFVDWPESMATVMMNAVYGQLGNTQGISTIGAALGAMFEMVHLIIADLWEGTDLLSMAGVQAALIMVLVVLMGIFAFGIILITKLLLALLFAVFPLFLLFLFFGWLKGIFEGWLRAAIAAALTPLFIFSLIALAFGLIERTMEDVVDSLTEINCTGSGQYGEERCEEIETKNISDAFPLLMITGGFFVLFLQLQGFVASIAAGARINAVAGMSAALHNARGVGRDVRNTFRGGSNAITRTQGWWNRFRDNKPA